MNFHSAVVDNEVTAQFLSVAEPDSLISSSIADDNTDAFCICIEFLKIQPLTVCATHLAGLHET